MPRWPDKEQNAAEMDAGKDTSVTLPITGSIAKEVEELRTIEVVHTNGVDTGLADALAFAEEKVTVMIHDSSDPNDENPVQLACNGVNQFLFRGQAQDVKRKYVEILANARRTRISTPEVTDATGARTNMVRKTSALRYPFSVIYDANPRGASWLKSLMSQGN